MKKSISKRSQKLFIVCLILGSVYLFNWIVIEPIKNQLISLGEDIETQQNALDKNRTLIERAQRLEDLYNQYLEMFKQSKTNDEVMSFLLSEIEQVAGQLNLPISDLKPKRVKTEEFYNRFSVSLTIDSGFEDILHFLHMLQNKPHLFDVEELRIDKGARRQTDVVKTSLVLSKVYIP